MLSQFFARFKKKEYTVQILSDKTSKNAVARSKRNRAITPVKSVLSAAIVVSAIAGGLVTTASATALTSSQAQADVLTDIACINGNLASDNSDEAGKWDAGSNRFAHMGGRSVLFFDGVNSSTPVRDSVIFGFRENGWGGARDITAYEKYGQLYPRFDAWAPVFADKTYDFNGVGAASNNTYNNNGKIPVSNLQTNVDTVEPGASGLTTTNFLSCMSLLPAIEAGVANMLSEPSRFITMVGLQLYGASFGTSISQEGSVLKPIGDAIDALITKDGGLRDALFVPFVIPLILIGAIWVGYIGIIKRAASTALQSTVWMVAAIAAGTVFLAQPTLISGFIDSSVATVQQTINEAVTGNQHEMCSLSGGRNEVTREIQCTIWYSTIYSPWVAGQFGVSSTSAGSADPNRQGGAVLTDDPRGFLSTSEARIFYGSNDPVQPTNWAQFMLDRQATGKSFENSEVAFAQLSGKSGMGVNSVWAGGGGNQISAAILMFFGSIASNLVLFVYGFALLIYQLVMVTAVLMSPFFFLLGIVPNWGRRVLMRYAEILVSIAVKRIITSLMLAIYFIFYQLITGAYLISPTSWTGALGAPGLLLQIILVGVLAVFAVFARGKFVNMFTQGINFGGNKSIGLPGGKAAAVGAGVAGAGLGAILAGPVGGLIGGLSASNKMRGQNRDLEHDSKNMNLAGSPTADVKPPRGGGSGGTPTPITPTPVNPTPVTSPGAAAVRAATDGKRIYDSAEKGKKTAEGIKKTADKVQGRNVARSAGEQAAKTAAETATNVGGQTASQGAAVVKAGPAAQQAARTAGQSAAGGTVTKGAAAAVTTPGAAPAAATAAVTPAATSSGAAAVASTGAAGTSAAAAGSTAAATTAAGTAAATGAGTAAAGAGAAGAVGAGAAAGSVVPVVGTAVGAAAGVAAVVAARHKRNKDNNSKQ